jgi:hypothetical protein
VQDERVPGALHKTDGSMGIPNSGRVTFQVRALVSNQSPVDMALDRARLRPGVDCALDAGHGGVPRVVNIAGLELDLDYLPAL